MASRRTVSQRIDDLIALDKSGGNSLVPGIIKALSDPSPSIRTNAVQIVTRRHVLEVLPQVESRFDDRSWLVRAEAAVCVGDLLEGSCRPHLGLRRLLKDEEWVVRIDSMESLAAIEASGAEREIAALLSDENGIVRSYCACILADRGGKKYLPKLRKALRADTDNFARVGIMGALFTLGEREHLPKMLGLFAEEDYRLRCAVIHNLEEILPLDERERAMVRKALNALRRKEPTRAVKSSIPRLLKLLKEQEKAERETAERRDL